MASSPDAPVWSPVTPAAVIDISDATGAIAVTTDGTTVWAATNDAILRINTATNDVERLAAPTESGDTTLAFDSDGLWVTRWAGGHVYRLDPMTAEVLLTVELPKAVRIAFVGDDLWVGREDTREMVLIDRTTGEIGRSISAGAFGAAGLGDLWFASGGTATIERVDPASGSVTATIQAQGETNCVLTGEFPGNVWTSCFGPDVRPRVANRIDPGSNSVVAVTSLPAGAGGHSVAVLDGETWYVGSFEDATGALFAGLLRLNPDTGSIERFVSIGPADPNIAVVAAGALWIPDEAGHRILRVNAADLSG